MSSWARPTDAPRHVEESLLLKILKFIFLLPSYCVVLFLRHRFGCRYIDMTVCMTAVGTIFMYTFFYERDTILTPARLYALSLIGLAAYHNRAAWNRFKLGELWHSYSDGVPRLKQLFPNVSERMLKCFIEPAVPIALSFVLITVGWKIGNSFETLKWSNRLFALGGVLFYAGLGHCALELTLYNARLQAMLDAIDRSIEARTNAEVMAMYQSGETTPPTPEHLSGQPVTYNPSVYRMLAIAKQREMSKQKEAETGLSVAAGAGGNAS